jgi:hypothetical protein
MSTNARTSSSDGNLVLALIEILEQGVQLVQAGELTNFITVPYRQEPIFFQRHHRQIHVCDLKNI